MTRWPRPKALRGALILLLLSTFVGVVVNEIRGRPLHLGTAFPVTMRQQVPSLDAASAARLPRVLFVDARSELEYRSSHISGAANLSVDGLQSDGRWPALGVGRPIVVYCGSGCPKAMMVAWSLLGRGYPTVYLLTGGFESWSAGSYPVTRGPNP